MLVEEYCGSKFTIFAEQAPGDRRSKFKVWLDGLAANHKNDRNFLLRRMQRYADGGVFGDKGICKVVHNDPKIIQWSATGLRVFWFHDRNRVVIAHFMEKRNKQRAKRAEIQRAIEFYWRYSAIARGSK